MKPNNPTLATLDELDRFDEIIDVRSPSEFADDHLPGAINLPVLDDEERARVGTLYKQDSPFAARKVGAALISRNIARHLEETLHDRPKSWRPLVYCWRGGQRSGSFTHILREIGWSARRLEGGYKVWRQHVLTRLETEPGRFRYIVIAGPTGSGKSRLLETLADQGGQILHLEALAAHKGSVLGKLPNIPQPSQKWFETSVLHTLSGLDPARPVFVEAESRVVGKLRLPEQVFAAIIDSPRLHIEATPAARVAFLLRDYAYLCDGDELARQLEWLVSIRGRAQVESWQAMAKAGDFPTVVGELLAVHYDPLYRNSMSRASDGGSGETLSGGDLSDADLAALASQLRQRFDPA